MVSQAMEEAAGMRFSVLLLSVMFFCGCSSPTEAPDSAGIPGGPDKSIEGITLIEMDGPDKKWELNAASAELIKDSGRELVKFRDYKMNFFEEEAAVSELVGNEGEYDRVTEIFDAQGRVEIISEDRKIITSDVRWHPVEEVFTTDMEVEIHTLHGIVRGVGMVASKNLNEIDIVEKISGELRHIEAD